MDYKTNKEIREYKGELAEKDAIIESEKYSFSRKLMGRMGKEMMEALEKRPTPKKKEPFAKLKYNIRKWKEQKEYKKYSKRENEIAAQRVQQYLDNKKGNH